MFLRLFRSFVFSMCVFRVSNFETCGGELEDEKCGHGVGLALLVARKFRFARPGAETGAATVAGGNLDLRRGIQHGVRGAARRFPARRSPPEEGGGLPRGPASWIRADGGRA